MAHVSETHAERVGSSGGDTLGTNGDIILFGLAGNDILTAAPGASIGTVLLGGPGDDVYKIDPGMSVLIWDSGGNDRLEIPGIRYDYAGATTIDGRSHVYLYDGGTNTHVVVADYQNTDNIIETYVGDVSLSHDQLASTVTAYPDVSLDQAASVIGSTRTDVLKSAQYLKDREAALLSEAQGGGEPDPGPGAGGDVPAPSDPSPPADPPAPPVTGSWSATPAARLFDADFYRAQNPDVAAAGVDPYKHFMSVGWKEGRDPNALFDTSHYLNGNSDVAAALVNPLEHYALYGWQEARDPSNYFDGAYYLEQNQDVAAAGLNPLAHFLLSGAAEGRLPYANVDLDGYLGANPDVAAAVDRGDLPNALWHYAHHGIAEGRPGVSPEADVLI